jgi:hypothetical protein
MKIKTTLAVAVLLTIGLVGLSSAAAHADTLTFTLANATQGIPVTGGSLTYAATVTAPSSNGAAVFLNGDSFSVTAPVTLNDSDFFGNFPLSLAPGTSFTGGLFVVTVPPGTAFGTYLGTFSLLGGVNGAANATLGTANFSVITTPEPSSIVLLLTGLGGMAAKLRRTNFKGSLRNRVS